MNVTRKLVRKGNKEEEEDMEVSEDEDNVDKSECVNRVRAKCQNEEEEGSDCRICSET